jgi:polar amino acid transport system ATP-binding protein
VIRIEGLIQRRDGQEMLKRIDLSVAKGDVAAIIGPSGSGKSTLLRCVNGLVSFDEGRIEVNGAVLAGGLTPRARALVLREVRARVGMVFQQFHLFPHMSVLSNVTEAPLRVARRRPEEARAEAMALLERVGIASKANRMPETLSGGEQQRVAIARALAMNPEVILFDEPTSALDPRMAAEVQSVIADLARDGQTMMVVTHSVPFARRIASLVHVLCEGRIVESGPPAQVLENPREPATREFLNRGS